MNNYKLNDLQISYINFLAVAQDNYTWDALDSMAKYALIIMESNDGKNYFSINNGINEAVTKLLQSIVKKEIYGVE
jgi:hypothetical protein